MLIRAVFNNVFSFGEEKEFNLLPNNRLKTLKHHNYDFGGFKLLKLASLYGANGAGKSNLIKSLGLFQKMVTSSKLPIDIERSKFKFHAENQNKGQLFAVEFIQNDIPLYYAMETRGQQVKTEELYRSGLGEKNDELVFERKTNANGETVIRFSNDFENSERGAVLKSVLIEDFVKPENPILKLLANRDNEHLKLTKSAFEWFAETIVLITPDSKLTAVAQRIDTDSRLKEYAETMMKSFNIGISQLKTEKKTAQEFFGEDNENEKNELIKQLQDSSRDIITLRSRDGEEFDMVKEDGEIVIKQLKLEHRGKDRITADFELKEESDGTIRIMDFVPAFLDVINKKRVYIIDEIERSIHPLLIKELVRKFSHDEKTKGQLIFTTHESHLLDQEIFRQDEIWFAEKKLTGATDLYSLSDFKIHKTIDIRKGYLNGRYGSIPFLANLEDLNWHS